ncbi:hypothetical protein [Arenibacter certesii]|uniref:PKD domain-containing protein n=1 Tax=Arenibacter certesii TaxID=228955 RepID=A0A918MPW5_9FLAO|nr:hypothetical protein [Arenibacter certesii]GGW45326.1 hypothetical protein GCM10007383_32090 [Arenibacter certesii]
MKTKLFYLSIFLVILFACEKDDTIDTPMNTLQAKAGNWNNDQLFTGQVIILNGSHSKDKQGKPFKYYWRFKNKPLNSLSLMEDENTMTPKFTPDTAGVYQIELKIYNDSFYDVDEVSLMVKEKDNPPLQEMVIIDADINEDTHFPNIFDDNSKIDYLITNDIHVKGNLTIAPAVTMAFETDKGLFVDASGSIIAVGALEGPIVLTGKMKIPGYWKGLVLNSNSSLNLLEKVTIEYGGSSAAQGLEEAANLALDNANTANLTLVNTKIQHSAGFGVLVERGTKLNLRLGNSINNNQKPMLLPASQLGILSGLTEFNENTSSSIWVQGDRVNNTEISNWICPRSTSSMPNYDISYLIMGKIEIASGVVISEGVDFRFLNNAEVEVTPSGFLTAVGTQQNPIKFQGLENLSGYWNGIAIKSNSNNNQLKHVEVYNAGNSIMDGFATKTAIAIDGENKARLSISDSKISESGGSGLLLENSTHLDGFSFVKFVGNREAAVTMSANHVAKLANAPALEFINNGHNGFEIYESILLNQNESVWPALNFNASYLISGNLSIQSGLKVLPGALFKLAEDKMIGIFPNGYLYAKGTNTQKIVFTGIKEIKGYWNGIQFQSDSPKNVMDFNEVNYAGKSEMPNISKITAIGLDGDNLANLTITNSKIAHGMGYGIVVEDIRASINSDYDMVNQFEDLSLGNTYR